MIVLDTHALIWWVNDNDQLTPRARKAIETELSEDRQILVSAITAWEIAMLVAKGATGADDGHRRLAGYRGIHRGHRFRPGGTGRRRAVSAPARRVSPRPCRPDDCCARPAPLGTTGYRRCENPGLSACQNGLVGNAPQRVTQIVAPTRVRSCWAHNENGLNKFSRI